MPAIHIRRLGLLLVAVAGSVILGACSSIGDSTRSALHTVTPYKVEVVQGNFVSKEQVEALKPGMTRQQVREILGTSLLSDVFHANRWDYVFTIRRQGVEAQQRRLTVYFNGEILERFEGDPMPSEAEFVATLETKRRSAKVPVLEASEESLKAFSKPAQPAQPAPAPAPATTTYPPLESPAR